MYQRSRKTDNDVRVPDNYRGTAFVPPSSAPAPLPAPSGDERITEPFPRFSPVPVPIQTQTALPAPTPDFPAPETAGADTALPRSPTADGYIVEPTDGGDRPPILSDVCDDGDCRTDRDAGIKRGADRDGCADKNKSCGDKPQQKTGTPSLRGVADLFGGQMGLEELLLLGVIFLLFSDGECRDNELLICLLLILFI